LAFESPEIGGHSNVVAIGWSGSGFDVASVTDSENNRYSIAQATTTGPGLSQAIFFAPEVRALRPDVVTVAMTGAPPLVLIRMYELKGVAALSTIIGGAGFGRGPPAGVSWLGLPFGGGSALLLAACTGCGPNASYGFETLSSPKIALSPIADAFSMQVTSFGGAVQATTTSTVWVMQVAAFAL
jgi:hypothetical protein